MPLSVKCDARLCGAVVTCAVSMARRHRALRRLAESGLHLPRSGVRSDPRMSANFWRRGDSQFLERVPGSSSVRKATRQLQKVTEASASGPPSAKFHDPDAGEQDCQTRCADSSGDPDRLPYLQQAGAEAGEGEGDERDPNGTATKGNAFPTKRCRHRAPRRCRVDSIWEPLELCLGEGEKGPPVVRVRVLQRVRFACRSRAAPQSVVFADAFRRREEIAVAVALGASIDDLVSVEATATGRARVRDREFRPTARCGLCSRSGSTLHRRALRL